MIHKEISSISPFYVMEVMEKAAELEAKGIDVVHLEVGEPDFNVPSCVSEAIEEAFKQGRTHYTHSLGDPELRFEIALKYRKKYGVDVHPDQILVTSGSSPSILLAVSVLCNEDNEFILSDPGYACYSNILKFVGAESILVPVNENNGFQFDPVEIKKRITKGTKAIIINSPMNPTGNLLSDEVMENISKIGQIIISDEIYHGLVYEGKERSILEFTDNAFVINGFSKLYAMTGLRLGYVIAPKKYIRILQKIQQNLFICAGSTVQRAGIAALKYADEDVLKMREIYNARRKFLIESLISLGFDIKVFPTGAFYVFVNAKHLSNDSYQLAFDILKKVHVGVTPGIDFGRNGEGFLRFSYANSLENIKKGMVRLKNYLDDFNPVC